jgi:hypothetical protein
MTPISRACFIPVHLEEFTAVLFRCSLICLSDLCLFPSTVIKSYKQRGGAIAAGTRRAASGLGTDFRGHSLPVYIQLAITANTASTSGVYGDAMDLQITENKFCYETSRQVRGTGHTA